MKIMLKTYHNKLHKKTLCAESDLYDEREKKVARFKSGQMRINTLETESLHVNT